MTAFLITRRADTHNIYINVWYPPKRRPWAKIKAQVRSRLSEDQVTSQRQKSEEWQRWEQKLILLVLLRIGTQDKYIS